MGGKLLATFLAAGLPMPDMIVGGRIEGGPHAAIYDFYADVLRSLIPILEGAGVATAAESKSMGWPSDCARRPCRRTHPSCRRRSSARGRCCRPSAPILVLTGAEVAANVRR